MTLSAFTVLMVLAIIFMILAALGVPSRVSWQPLAWACIFAAILFSHGVFG